MHEEIVQFLHQLRVFLFCSFQVLHVFINTLPGCLKVVLNQVHSVFNIILHAIAGLRERNHLMSLVDGRCIHTSRAEQLLILQAVQSGNVIVL